jgi:hypothetical protein
MPVHLQQYTYNSTLTTVHLQQYNYNSTLLSVTQWAASGAESCAALQWSLAGRCSLPLFAACQNPSAQNRVHSSASGTLKALAMPPCVASWRCCWLLAMISTMTSFPGLTRAVTIRLNVSGPRMLAARASPEREQTLHNICAVWVLRVKVSIMLT